MTDKLCIGELFRQIAPSQRLKSLPAWPPDAFAFTSALLRRSGAYRRIISPPAGRRWPLEKTSAGRSRLARWSAAVRRDAARWRLSFLGPAGTPRNLAERWRRLVDRSRLPVRYLAEDGHFDTLCDIMTLHAAADEACEGVGLPLPPVRQAEPEGYFWWYANTRLLETGSLSSFPPSRVRVLPKLRTPQTGITLRSFSFHLSAVESEINVSWEFPQDLRESAPEERHAVNLLLVPWPREVGPEDFQPLPSPTKDLDPRNHGFFEYSPRSEAGFSADAFRKVLTLAKRRVGTVDVVVFPEAALSTGDMEGLATALEEVGEPGTMVLAGLREGAGTRGAGALGANFVQFGGKRDGYKRWRQDKHHRWRLDEGQILQYHLGASLNPALKWWEGIRVDERRIHFHAFNEWLTLCPLICEDLAQQEPASEVVRAVGPTLVIALLMDGPQLKSRWPARYATVLADDPGSSVLTLTSLGMAQRSRPAGAEATPIVALWKDAKTGLREISLQRDSQAIVLTVCVDWRDEWTADGRECPGTAACVYLSAVEQI